ncbi:MAG: glycosyltransferase family 39 protein [Planctomycetaceae bacterium]|jgi:hypothetical protein|nr:glycosyltransferase family 39 protein [Planctomycetaceae bacterium]
MDNTDDSVQKFRDTWIFVIVLLFVHSLLLGYAAACHSPTALEPPLLAAGVSHWELGRYELYRVNPHLVRMVAAIPVMLVGCETNWTRFVDGPRTRPEYSIGSQFIEINGERSLWLMTLARWACIPFSLIGGLYCFFWSRELYRRDTAGLIAVTLWCFDPIILGNAELITNDVAAASFGLVAGYYFWHWLKSPTWMHSIIVAFTLALAILAKTTWLFLFGLYPIMAILWFGIKYRKHEQLKKRFDIIGTQILLMFFIVLWIINAFYGFDGSFDEYGSYSFVSKKFAVIDNKNPPLASLPVPLPRQFLIGLDTQISDFEHFGQMSYLAGQWQDRGWWSYYVYGLLVKETHGIQILLLLAVLTAVFWKKARISFDEIILILLALSVIFIVSSQVAFNTHFRYVIPFVGLTFVFIGRVVLLMEQKIMGKMIVPVLIFLSIISSLLNYPHLLAYFNELSGGTKNGYKHLLHSAIDWGQDLRYLKKWLDSRPEIHLDGLAYHGGFEPSAIGITCPKPPIDHNSEMGAAKTNLTEVGPLPGWYALSTNSLYGHDKEYCYFQKLKPIDIVGVTIYIFYITQEDANRIRKELGLPVLNPIESENNTINP